MSIFTGKLPVPITIKSYVYYVVSCCIMLVYLCNELMTGY